MKTAVISGISGQDGAYLAQRLSNRGYKILGIVRENYKTHGIDYLEIKNITFQKINLCEKTNVEEFLRKVQPDYFYNLAAQSSVGESFKDPHASILFNINSTLNILESIRLFSSHTKFYQATSSDMFGSVNNLPIDENSLLQPNSPYAISKAACHHLVRNYREAYDLKACSGILFNHESVLRRGNFFVMKVIKTALDIFHGKTNELRVGNINLKRDFGFAPAYVEAMVMMMESEFNNDYIICSGQSITLRSIIEHVFASLDIPNDRIIVDESFFRPSDIVDIYGDNSKAKSDLGWEYNMSFYDILDIILKEYEKNIYKV